MWTRLRRVLGGTGLTVPKVEVNQVGMLVRAEASAWDGEAALAPLAGQLGLTLHRSGRVLWAWPREGAPTPAALELALQASKRAEVEVAFAFGFDDGAELQASEGTVELRGGAWIATQSAEWSDIPAAQLAEVRTLDTWVWERFPLSLMARRLGLEERPVSTRFFAHAGSRWPDDVPGLVHRRQVQVSQVLVERLRAVARENGARFASEVARRLSATPVPPADFAAPELRGQPQEISIFLSDALLLRLNARAAEEDCPLGRLVERTLAASLR